MKTDTQLAPTRLEASRFTGRPRIVCTICNKSAHPTRASAETIADRILRRRGDHMDVYQGLDCGWFHLTTSKEKDHV